jgi:hypothetical protein
MLCSVMCRAPQYFSPLSHKRHAFRGKNAIKHKTRVWFFSITFMIYYIYLYLTAIGLTPGGSSTAHIYTHTFLILWRNEKNIVMNVYWSSCKVPGRPVRYSLNFNVPDNLSKYLNIKFNENPSNGRSRVVPWGWTDGVTDRQTVRHVKLVVAFLQFCERA